MILKPFEGSGYAEVMVHDGHGEYGPGMFFPHTEGVPKWRAGVLWDFSGLFFAAYQYAGVTGALTAEGGNIDGPYEERVDAAFETLFPGYLEEDLKRGDVYLVTGKPDQLHACWQQAVSACCDEPPTGDDSCFDYWPSGVEALYEFSRALDTLTAGDSTYMVDAVAAVKACGEQTEFVEDLKHLWESE